MFSDDERRFAFPSGSLRIAVAVGPTKSASWCKIDSSTGRPDGVPVDLGLELAQRLGLPAEIISYESSGAIVEDAENGKWDVCFIPVDGERRKYLVCGASYFVGESTFLVSADVGAESIEDVDRDGIIVAAVENTATIRSARRILNRAKVLSAKQLGKAIALFESGQADALALGRESLRGILTQMKRPSIVLEGNIHVAHTALAVPPSRNHTAAILDRLLEATKTDGTLRGIFDKHGLSDAAIAL